MFLEVTIIIGSNTSTECLHCIKCDKPSRKSLMLKQNMVLRLFSPNLDLFYSYPQIVT